MTIELMKLTIMTRIHICVISIDTVSRTDNNGKFFDENWEQNGSMVQALSNTSINIKKIKNSDRQDFLRSDICSETP